MTNAAPTTKQIALATKLFNKIAATSAKHGCPLSRKTFREDMVWLEMNPDSRKDVSEYIGMHFQAKIDASLNVRRAA